MFTAATFAKSEFAKAFVADLRKVCKAFGQGLAGIVCFGSYLLLLGQMFPVEYSLGSDV